MKKLGILFCLVLVALAMPLMANGSKDAGMGEVPVLKWYFIGTPQTEEAMVEEKINEYIEPLIGCKVEIIVLNWGAEYNETMTTIIGAGEPFDICFTSNWANNYKQNIAINAFMPLNELTAEHAPGIEKTLGKDFMYATARDGVLYALPVNKEKAHNFGFLFRKDLLEKYNVDLSRYSTLEDLNSLFAMIKEKEQGVFPLGNWGGGDSVFFLLDWDRPAGNKIPLSISGSTRGAEVINVLEDSKTIDYLRLARDWYEKGFVQADSATMSEFVADEAAGLVFATPKQLKPGKDGEYASMTPGFEWIQWDYTAPVMTNNETDGSMMAISVGSKHPVEAIKFLELLYTDKYLVNLVTFGIEGVHYDKVSENVINVKEGSGYSPGTGWMFGNQFLNYTMSNEDPAKWELFEKYNEDAQPLENLGFSFNPDPVKNQIAACQNVWDEYMQTLQVGAMEDIDTYLAECLESFEAVGLEDIRKEMQSQYDAWKNN